MKKLCVIVFILSVIFNISARDSNIYQNNQHMEKRVLFVVTSHDKMGDTGKPTGYTLAEVTHPWKVLRDAGYEIDIVSPKGGKAPVDGFDMNDPVNKEVWESEEYQDKINSTLKPEEVNPSQYPAIFYAGGHGTMWDFPDNADIQRIGRAIYEAGGIISAVCHGPAGLINLKLSDGNYLIDGRKINSFTNEEEKEVKADEIVPFLLENKLKERGADYEKSGNWQVHVAVDGRIITGQNPQSAKAVGEAILQQIGK